MLLGKPSIKDAILEINPKAEYKVENEDIKSIEFINGTAKISSTEINKKLAELNAQWEKENYARTRKVSYPSMEEQLDMQYWDAVNGTTTWKDTIAKVKADNPKE